MSTLQIHLKSFRGVNFFFVFLFVYFMTIPAELLHIKISLFKLRVNHVLALWLFVTLCLSQNLRIADRKLFIGFLVLLSSFILSAIQGIYPYRSFGYILVALFTYTTYFLLPLNLMLLFDTQKILRLYFVSFLFVGIHAALQLFLSAVGIIDPFVTQYVNPSMETGLARGQAMTYEPSFYALYAIPFVVYANAKYLLAARWSFGAFLKIIGINLLLLLSTSTGAFFSYFVFCMIGFSCSYLPLVRKIVTGLRRNLLVFMGGFGLIFCTIGLFFQDLFINTFYKFFKMGFLSHWSFLERWKGIVDAWNAFCQFPLFGLGLGGVGYYQCMHTHQEGLAKIHIPTLELIEPFDPTNMFTEMLASLGFYGLLAFSYFGWVIYRIAYKLLKNPLISLEEKKTTVALLFSVVVMFICLQFNQGIFRSYIWTHLGIFVGYCLKTTANAESKDLLV
jgi:hypothetical protein